MRPTRRSARRSTAARYAAQAELSADHLPRGVVVVAPPWNFPYAIPAGGVFAALMAGNAVVLKPAPQTPRTAWLLAEQCWRAGVPPDVLHYVACPDGDVGRRLITHPGVATVVLTGAHVTALQFLEWRPSLHLLAETSGKNAIVVTSSADIDAAVRDVVRSAFGHAGQKCSAASLLILTAPVHDDGRFLRRLGAAVRTLRVGWPNDPATTMGPLIEPPGEVLRRGLTELDAGESWLLQPASLDGSGRLWSPGVRLGVRPGSWFHQTECFGPVLGVMRADDLDHAIELQNATPFGLTGGIHSLDEEEVDRWLRGVEVGNAYVNRHITGAIVRRQPFGGWKRSSVGGGPKAGGPNYVAAFATPHSTPIDVEAVRASYVSAWHEVFAVDHDPSGLRSEGNILRYVPLRHVAVLVGDGTPAGALDAARIAARVCGVRLTVVDRDLPAGVDRLRVLASVAGEELLRSAHAAGIAVDPTPIDPDGRFELVHWVREQAVSITRHRHGRLTEPRPLPPLRPHPSPTVAGPRSQRWSSRCRDAAHVRAAHRRRERQRARRPVGRRPTIGIGRRLKPEPGLLGDGHRGARWAGDERPQLLGDAPVVARRAQLAEQGVQPEVDPLDEHERPRHGGVLGDRAGAVERVPDDPARVRAAPRHRLVEADRLVELAEVLADLLVGGRGARAQHPGALEHPAERGGVVVVRRGAHHRHERGDLGVGEVLDQAEVEERHPTAAVEQVVARMGVAVELVHPVQRAEHEAEQALAGEVALVLVPGEQLLPRRAGDQLGRQHPRRRQLGQHVGDVDERVVAVVVGEVLLVLRLPPVVELLDQTLLDLGHHLVGIETAEALTQDRAEQVGGAQVALDGLADAGVLHLDGDGSLDAVRVDDDGAVHLPDARRGDRQRVPLDEQAIRRRAELALDHARGEVAAHGRGVGAQLGQRVAQRLGQSVVEVAGHLAELHQRALHAAEPVGHGLGGAQLALAVELDAPRRRGEQLARRGRRIGRTDGCTEARQVDVALAPASTAPRSRAPRAAGAGR